MKIFGRKIEGYPKYVVLFSTSFLISLGLCGLNGEVIDRLGWHLLGIHNPDTPLVNILVNFDFIIGFVIAISAFCLVVTIIFWLFESISTILNKRFAKSQDRIENLLDDSSEEKSDDSK